MRSWPLRFPRARAPGDLRFIFCGKELGDSDAISEVRSRSKTEAVVIHLVVRERNPSSPMTPTSVAPERASESVRVRPGPLLGEAPPTPPETPEHQRPEQEAHFHAVTVSERELSEFRMIFDKKKGPDGLMSMPTLRAVLHSYWRFIHREGFEANPTQFPEERLEQLRRKVDATDGLTLDQFLTIFYLFDNAASEQPCAHGDRERVRIATAQLHAMLQPHHEFYHDKFDQLFALVCSDENQQTLSCKEMELLYYMYSAHVLEQVREEELVSRVQAIVRMRLQSSKYVKLVDAARTLQNAWRMRMFAADRNNHQRITEFLRSLMMPMK